MKKHLMAVVIILFFCILLLAILALQGRGAYIEELSSNQYEIIGNMHGHSDYQSLYANIEDIDEPINDAEPDALGSAEYYSYIETDLSSSFPVLSNAQCLAESTNQGVASPSGFFEYSNGHLVLAMWRIYSFCFLLDLITHGIVENITALTLRNVYVAQGTAMPHSEILIDLAFINLEEIHGSGPADMLVDLLPLPNVEVISLSGNHKSGNPLPHTPSLVDLYMVIPDALYVIQHNSHISGILHLGRTASTMSQGNWGGNGHNLVTTLDGIEQFIHLQALSVPRNVSDLSPLESLVSLKVVDLIFSENIDSILPLSSLPHLQDILINEDVYNRLPANERQVISPANNSYYKKVHIHFINTYDIFNPINPTIAGGGWIVDSWLTLESEVIENFAFLQDYPGITRLEIYNSEIISFDYLDKYATDLVSLVLIGNIFTNDITLPYIESLKSIGLNIIYEGQLQLLKHNSHLPGVLVIEVSEPYGDGEVYPLHIISFDALRCFTSLQLLEIYSVGYVLDLSALLYMNNLHTFVSNYFSLQSFSPLVSMPRLRQVVFDSFVWRGFMWDDELRVEVDSFNEKFGPWYLRSVRVV